MQLPQPPLQWGMRTKAARAAKFGAFFQIASTIFSTSTIIGGGTRRGESEKSIGFRNFLTAAIVVKREYMQRRSAPGKKLERKYRQHFTLRKFHRRGWINPCDLRKVPPHRVAKPPKHRENNLWETCRPELSSRMNCARERQSSACF